ncbi:MAG: ATP-NAD kinase family protein [Clostridiales Family XIII bacterium]|jgi:predicted polyphosphate/ATP-dependent NAD kinase|nr:ATP-NAD kinase family protein [Clostridiales Family XIII bacterium]
MKKIGLIVNPVAGIGGKVGLKGSDGIDTQRRARELGAVPESDRKAELALRKLHESLEDADSAEIYTWPGAMGGDIAKGFPFRTHVIGELGEGGTTASDTMDAAVALKAVGVDLILFAGGDGTARNILDAVGDGVPVLGIPAGCKIHSAVYAVNPRSAGELVASFVEGRVRDTRESEVMDIDEELFREDRVDAKLYGYLRVPNAGQKVQNLKSGRGYSESGSIEFLSRCVADSLEDDTLYIVGGGSTTKRIMGAVGLPDTLLGIDLFRNRKIVKNDAAERDILGALGEYPKAKIIVTVIGGQGYLFGRGNQQISAEVIKRVGRDNIIIAASKDKMNSLFGQPLYVDTGDDEVNASLTGYHKILVGYDDYVVFKVAC